MAEEVTAASGVIVTIMEFDNIELARLLHIDADNEDEIANARVYVKSAEEYLNGAGCKKDYTSNLYKQLVIILVSRSLEKSDMLVKQYDMTSSGLVSMVEQLRRTQAVTANDS